MDISKEKHLLNDEIFKYTEEQIKKKSSQWRNIYKYFQKEMKDKEKILFKDIKAVQYNWLRNEYKKKWVGLKTLRPPLKKDMKQIEFILHEVNLKSNSQTEKDIQDLINTLEKTYIDTYNDNNYLSDKSSGVIGRLHKPNIDRMNRIITKSFAGNTFSSRLWNSKDRMINDMQIGITKIFAGKNNLEVQREILREYNKLVGYKFKVKAYDVSRVFRTEHTRIASESDKDYYKADNIKKYEYVATFDKRTSEICRELDGQVFDSDKMQVGVNAPPMHVNCRSTTVPYFKDTLGRVGRNKDGDSVLFPKEIRNYKQYEEYMKSGKIPKVKVEPKPVPKVNPKPIPKVEPKPKTKIINIDADSEKLTKFFEYDNLKDVLKDENLQFRKSASDIKKLGGILKKKNSIKLKELDGYYENIIDNAVYRYSLDKKKLSSIDYRQFLLGMEKETKDSINLYKKMYIDKPINSKLKMSKKEFFNSVKFNKSTQKFIDNVDNSISFRDKNSLDKLLYKFKDDLELNRINGNAYNLGDVVNITQTDRKVIIQHELTHYIDQKIGEKYGIKKPISTLVHKKNKYPKHIDDLFTAYKKEVENLKLTKTKFSAQKTYEKQQKIEKIVSKIVNDTGRTISDVREEIGDLYDMLSGFTNGTVNRDAKLYWSHDKKYWTNSGHNLTEALANIRALEESDFSKVTVKFLEEEYGELYKSVKTFWEVEANGL